MSFKSQWYADKLAKRRTKGFRGYPMATIAYYGPDDKRASKVAVGIVPSEGAEIEPLERWFAETGDVRVNGTILEAVVRFLESHAVKSVTSVDRIIGCPHEEGIDYPEGEPCPKCPFWVNRDRWGTEQAP